MAFSVKDCMLKICEYFDPAKAGDRKMTLVYKFRDNEKVDGVYTIRIENGTCTLEDGEAPDFTTKMVFFTEGYERIVQGKMWLLSAYWNGTVRYIGETLGWEELQTYLTIPADSGIAAL